MAQYDVECDTAGPSSPPSPIPQHKRPEGRKIGWKSSTCFSDLARTLLTDTSGLEFYAVHTPESTLCGPGTSPVLQAWKLGSWLPECSRFPPADHCHVARPPWPACPHPPKPPRRPGRTFAFPQESLSEQCPPLQFWKTPLLYFIPTWK